MTHNLPVVRRKYQIIRLDSLTKLHFHPMKHLAKDNWNGRNFQFLDLSRVSQTRLIQHYHKIPSGVLTHPSHPSLPPQSPSPPNPVPLPYSCLRLLLTEKVTRDFQDQNNRFLPFWEYRSLFTSRFVYWQDRIWNAKVKQLKLQYLLFPWRAQNIFRYLDRICSSDKQLGITP